MNPLKESRMSVLKVQGIVGFVGNQNGPLPIPNQEIDDIQTVLAAQPKWCVLPALEAGDRVRVIRGALTGVEGKLVRAGSESRLIISIEMIRQSLAVQVNRADVELLSAGVEFSSGVCRSSAA
jgi:transcriptional antiterminator NusG